jgi:drug/metabolite transporter (DMT)-like permease
MQPCTPRLADATRPHPHLFPPQTASALSAVRGVMAALCFVPYAWSVRRTLPGLPRAFWAAAGELALWNFLSQGLLNIALLYTDAMRVSFIAQTAIVLTPLIAASQGHEMRPSVWAGCAVALAGVALLASDGNAAVSAVAGAAAPGFRLSLGDGLALGGAVTSSLYIYRISELGKQGLSNDLTQAIKVAIIAALYCVWAAVDGARLVAAGGALVALWPGWRSMLAWGVLAYSAIVPGALADVLQARGQAKVGAAEAQVLLGAEPLWTAVLGMALLGERLGRSGWCGAGLIVVAVLLASGAAEALLARRGGGGAGEAAAASEPPAAAEAAEA